MGMAILRTSEETAVLIAAMMGDATRARVSDKTIRLLSGRRRRLEGSFRQRLNDDLAEYGYVVVALPAGGQTVVRISALEAAKTLTAVKAFTRDELREIRLGTPDFNAYRARLEENEEQDEDDDGE
jgi:hypothetical protein